MKNKFLKIVGLILLFTSMTLTNVLANENTDTTESATTESTEPTQPTETEVELTPLPEPIPQSEYVVNVDYIYNGEIVYGDLMYVEAGECPQIKDTVQSGRYIYTVGSSDAYSYCPLNSNVIINAYVSSAEYIPDYRVTVQYFYGPNGIYVDTFKLNDGETIPYTQEFTFEGESYVLVQNSVPQRTATESGFIHVKVDKKNKKVETTTTTPTTPKKTEKATQKTETKKPVSTTTNSIKVQETNIKQETKTEPKKEVVTKDTKTVNSATASVVIKKELPQTSLSTLKDNAKEETKESSVITFEKKEKSIVNKAVENNVVEVKEEVHIHNEVIAQEKQTELSLSELIVTHLKEQLQLKDGVLSENIYKVISNLLSLFIKK